MNSTTQLTEYDVVIMGAGFAGLCQARHLLLNIPNIRVAIVDPRSEKPSEKEHRLGESTVEVAALLLYRELGLFDYIVENHTPKAGLNFHWPKDPAKTETMDDYYHNWINRQLSIPTFHINRSKFDLDLLQMNQEMGAVFYNGRVVDLELTPDDASKTVKIKVGKEYLELKAKHVIDAAGRKFIIGKKMNNIVFDPENLVGINNGAAWVWLKNIDRTLFDHGYRPTETLASRYYATNHWMGHGHWLWMIPLDTKTKEISIGVVHHHDVVPAQKLNTADKFYAFLKANHNMLYKIVKSGELIDFNYYPRLAHKSKTLFSPDNWYVIGEAACNFDAFYSFNSTVTSFQIESVTEIIRAKLASESDAEEKREAYNQFNLGFVRYGNQLVSHHPKQLGNASIMSWRIYLDAIWFFGLMIPMYFGKWHLEPKFISLAMPSLQENLKFIIDVYEQCNELSDRGINIGLMELSRADQMPGKFSVFKFRDDFLENEKLESKHCNIFVGFKWAAFYTVIWFVMLQWKGFGLRGLLKPRHLYHIFRLLLLVGKVQLSDWSYRFQSKNIPANSHNAKKHQEFKKYQYRPELKDWSTEEAKSQNLKSTIQPVKV